MAFRPWEYRTETGSVGYEVDLTGYSVAAVDGDIGHVDEAINELLGGSYLLVDTGPVFGRTVMLPAGVVERIDTADKKIYLDRTKDQIKNAPEFDERADHAEYRHWVGGYYAEPYSSWGGYGVHTDEDFQHHHRRSQPTLRRSVRRPRTRSGNHPPPGGLFPAPDAMAVRAVLHRHGRPRPAGARHRHGRPAAPVRVRPAVEEVMRPPRGGAPRDLPE